MIGFYHIKDGMSVCYNKLWKLLIDRNMNKTDLRLAAGITTTALAKLDLQISKTESAIAFSTQSKKKFDYNARLKEYKAKRELLLTNNKDGLILILLL